MRSGLVKLFLGLVTVSALTFVGCTDENTTEPIDITELAPPTGVKVVIDGIMGGSSFATVSWSASTDETKSDFKGYAVVTDSVNASGVKLGKFDSVFVDKNVKVKSVLSLKFGARYVTKVMSINTNGKFSVAAKTIIYAGIRAGDGAINQFMVSGTAKSSFGWDPATGAGTQYAYDGANGTKIDLHCRLDGNSLTFFSPDAAPAPVISNARTTKLAIVTGTGQSAYDLTDPLQEPNLSKAEVVKDNVYLLKTKENYYVKVWVKDIKTVGSGASAYKEVSFVYKMQPVMGLRVAKK